MLIFYGLGEGVFHIFNILLLAYLIKGCEFTIKYNELIGSALLLLFSLTMYKLYDTTELTLTLNIFVEFIVFFITVKLSKKDKIIYFFLIIFIESFLTSIVGLIGVLITVGDQFYNFMDVFETMVVFCLLAMIASAKFHTAKTKQLEKTNNFIQIYLALELLLSTFILLGIKMFGSHISIKLFIALITLAVLSPIINVLMYAFCIKKYAESAAYKNDLNAMEVVLQLQDNHFHDMVNSYSDLKVFRHDVNSYLNTINELVDQQRYDELHLLTNDLKHTINANTSICSNIYISASINQFSSVMEKGDIDFTFHYEVFDDFKIKNMHLCSLFYNLLSNAIEASMLTNEKKSIELTVYAKKTTLVIKIINSVSTLFNIRELEIGKTKKKDEKNHGIGLRSIQNVVDIYNGNIRREVVQNRLHTEIVLFDAMKGM